MMAVRRTKGHVGHPVWELDVSYTNPVTGKAEDMQSIFILCMSPDEAISFVKSALNLGHCAKTFRVSKIQDVTEFVPQEDYELWDYGEVFVDRYE